MSNPAQQTAVSAVMTGGFPGMASDSGRLHDVISKVSGESSAQILFGTFVQRGANDDQVLNLTAAANLVLGMVAHSHAYEKDIEVGTVGLNPGVTVGVARHGRWLALSDTTLTQTAALHMNVDNNSGHTPGALSSAATVGHSIAVTGGIKVMGASFTYTPAGGSAVNVVEVELAMTGFSSTAD